MDEVAILRHIKYAKSQYLLGLVENHVRRDWFKVENWRKTLMIKINQQHTKLYCCFLSSESLVYLEK